MLVCCYLRLGSAYWQPRENILCGPRKPNNHLAAAHWSPGPTDPSAFQLHTANGAAESPVRIVQIVSAVNRVQKKYYAVSFIPWQRSHFMMTSHETSLNSANIGMFIFLLTTYNICKVGIGSEIWPGESFLILQINTEGLLPSVT